MKIKRLLIGALAVVGCMGLASCGEETGNKTLKIAAFEGGHGADFIKELAKKYEANNKDLKVEVDVRSNIAEIVRPQILAGNTPDFMYLPTGGPLALTETMLKDKAVLELSDVLASKIPGENVTVKEKVLPGFFDTTATNPYGDGKTYLAPLFYSATGLFYNQDNFSTGKHKLPTTWDEMFALGDKLNTANTTAEASKKQYLFTYPTAGYFDGFMFSMMGVTGGNALFDSCTSYEDNIWTSNKSDFMFNTVGKLKDYLLPSTVGNANSQGFLDNQKSVMDNRALFIPNGNWLPGEMKDVTPAANFKWGFMGLPKKEASGSSYAYTYMEQCYIPKYGKNTEEAKKFMAWMYSDEACQIILEKTKDHAPTPIKGSVEKMKKIAGLDPVNVTLFESYDNGVKPIIGNFTTTDPIEGVTMAGALYGTIDSVMKGEKTVAQWRSAVEEVSDKLRAKIKK